MPNIILGNAPISLSDIRFTLTYGDEYVNSSVTNTDYSHIHNCTELYINLEGNVSFLVKNELYPISRGDVILTRANEFHHCVYHRSGIHKHFCLWLSENEALMSLIGSRELHYIHSSEEECEELIRLFYELHSAVTANDTLGQSAALLAILLRLRKSANSTAANTPSSSLPSEFQGILDHVSRGYKDITNVCELCEVFFISPSTLNRWFVKYLKVTPKTYLETIKLSEAKKMLCTGKSVTDTCFDCGFSDLSHFIRVFKRKFGMTPRAYYLSKSRGIDRESDI